MPLILAPLGITHIVKKIGGNTKTRQFLEALGFTIGSRITIISENHGAIIVTIRNSRMAVSKEIATNIII